MKRIILAIMAVSALAACSDTSEVIREYAPEEISFTLSDPGNHVADQSEVAVIAECIRDGESITMSENPVARYVASVSSGKVTLSPASEEDRVYARYGDTGLTYTAVYPYSETVSMEPEVPAVQSYGQAIPSRVYGIVSATDVSIPVVIPVSEKPLCSVLSLELPSDLVASETVTVLSMSLLGVEMDFGDGLELSENKVVELAVNPFIVPNGGIAIDFSLADGSTVTSVILSGDSDSGIEVLMGEKLVVYVPSADKFKPCTFPVVFPLGVNPDARTGYYNYSDDQPDWQNRGIWRCFSQKQVYATWNQVSEPSSSLYQRRELINTGDIGSVGVKGIWTGDYFEFVFPVENIEAGSVVSFEAPFYGRQQPIFWTVEWLDGEEWVSNTKQIASWDSSVTLEASFSTVLYGTVINYSFRLANAIEQGELRVRLVCTDGSWQADTSTGAVVQRSLPYNDGSAYQAPFYFYCEGSGVNAFTWNISPGFDGSESAGNDDLTVYDQEWQWDN